MPLQKPLDKVNADRLEELLAHTVDFHGRRITNAGDPVRNYDYTTKLYVDNEIKATSSAVGLKVDTDFPGVAVNLTVEATASNSDIPGNGFDVLFYWPLTNVFSGNAYWVWVHDSGTLPTITTFDTGTAGAIVAGINILKDASKSFTPGALVGKDIIIFSRKRTGSPTHDLEGQIVFSQITGNGTNWITFDYQGYQAHTDAGLKYYIVTPNAGNHLHEKLKHVAFSESKADAQLRSVRFTGATATIYVWVIFNNVWGMGDANSPAISATFTGLDSGEIKTSAIITSKINNLAITELKLAALAVTNAKVAVAAIDTDELAGSAVTAAKIAALTITAAEIAAGTITGVKIAAGTITATNITGSTLSAIYADLGTITAGTVTGATLRTAASGTRIELDSTNGLRCFSGSDVRTQIPLAGANISDVMTFEVRAISGNLTLVSNSDQAVIALRTSGLCDIHVDDGSGLDKIVTISASGINIAQGGLDVDAGNLTLTAGNLTLTNGTLNIDNTNGVFNPRNYASATPSNATGELSIRTNSGDVFLEYYNGSATFSIELT